MSESVHILKVTNNLGQLAAISWQFETGQLKETIAGVLGRILPDDTTGIAPVEIVDSGHETTFFVRLLRPLAHQGTVDALIRVLARQYEFETHFSTISEQDYEDMALESLFGEAPDFPPS